MRTLLCEVKTKFRQGIKASQLWKYMPEIVNNNQIRDKTTRKTGTCYNQQQNNYAQKKVKLNSRGDTSLSTKVNNNAEADAKQESYNDADAKQEKYDDAGAKQGGEQQKGGITRKESRTSEKGKQ